MSRYTDVHRCRKCRQPVLVGLDGDLCAWIATVDRTPLSPLGEALALLAGRATYHLRQNGRRLYLDRRDRWQIAGNPAGESERLWPFDVVADHVCNSPPLPSIDSCLPDKPKPRKDSDNDNSAVGTLFETIPY